MAAATAAPTGVPSAPLIVVLGSTGTGKSELAVKLARRFRGEIINADAMQLYAGLPILTNKITFDEQKGVPHHLLGHISKSDAPWTTDEFAREARRTVDDIRARGNVPIIVGGTQYYVDSLLFKDIRLGEAVDEDDGREFPILEEPTEVLLAELQKVDPIMAKQWHPNDRRKIRRSLEIFLRTGTPASIHYAEQAERKAATEEGSTSSPWENLLFWVYSEREVLKARLDARIDKMVDNGLVDEVREVLAFKQQEEAAGRTVDMSRGIWQSIGYRQLEPYTMALDSGLDDQRELEKLKVQGLEEMKAATRQYARSQIRWTRLKQMPLLTEQGPQALDSLYVLDSTDVSAYKTAVIEPAFDIMDKFLKGEVRPHPRGLSAVAAEVLGKTDERKAPTPCDKTCELCGTNAKTEESWQRHIKSSGHRKTMKKAKRLALVPVEQPPTKAEPSDEPSSPEIGSMFS